MKKKILFVINTLGQAGAECAMLNLIKSLDEQAFDISLYIMLNQGDLLNEVPEYVHILNRHPSSLSVLDKKGKGHMIKEVIFALLRHGSGIRNIPYFIENFKAMKKKHTLQWDKLLWREIACGAKRFSEEFDLAIAYLEGASTYYVADYVRAKKKVAWIHVDMELAGYTKSLNRDAYEKMDACFVVSSELKEGFFHIHPECEKKTFVFENILDRTDIRKRSEKGDATEFDKNSFCILTVGRLHPQKGYDLVVEVMSDFKKKGYPIKWYIMGEGPLRSQLEKKIKAYDVEEELILLGAKKNPYPYFARCDLYVHPSRFEGKSIAISEAKLLGAPVVVSDVSGNRQQVKNNVNGLLCNLTKEELETSIISLYENEPLRKKMGNYNKNQSDNMEKDSMKLLLNLLEEPQL